MDPIQADTPESMQHFMRDIPKSWSICSLSIDPILQELIIFRQSVQVEPIICRIPLKRQFSREGEVNALDYKDVMARWNAILNDNNDTTHAGKECESLQDKTEWWKKRKDIDERLKDLVLNIEQTWLGCFKVRLIIVVVYRR
jgi:separase